MNMTHCRRISKIYFLSLVFFLCFIDNACARFDIIDHGARSSSRGGAFVARADNGSALYYNPAGITQIKGGIFQEDAFIVFRDTKYESLTGAGERMTSTHFLPNIFFVADTQNDNWKWGMAIYIPFGSSTEWSDCGPLRYQATLSSLKMVNYNPTVACKINPRLSFGFGVNIYESSVISRKMIDYGKLVGASGSADGVYSLEADNAYAAGYNLGILYLIDEKSRIGISYRSRFDIYYKGNATISNIPGYAPGAPRASSPAKAKYKLPDVFMIGYSCKPTEKLEIEADIQWTNWSRFSQVQIDFDQETVLTDTFIAKNYHDSIIYKLGVEYFLNDSFSLRSGYAYSKDAIPSSTFEPSNPSNTRHSFYLGSGYQKNNFRADIALAFTFFVDRFVDNTVGNSSGTSIDGTYKTFIPQITAGFGWVF